MPTVSSRSPSPEAAPLAPCATRGLCSGGARISSRRFAWIPQSLRPRCGTRPGGGSPGGTSMSSSLTRGVYRGTAALWGGVARIAGRTARWTPNLWHSPGGQRVLVVAPHPDDEIGCGGTLLLHRAAGDHVHVAYVTDGRRSRATGLGPDAMAERRRQEMAAAAPLLGLAGAHWLGLREGEWEASALVPALRRLLRQTAAQIVYAPSLIDFHPEHIRVAGGVAQAIAELPGVALRVYQLHVPLTPALVNLVAPIQSVIDELVQAMHCYATQIESIRRCLRMKRYGASLYGLAGSAEEFWHLDASNYRRLHIGVATASRDGQFRGVRALPFSDPLAYLRGLGARRALHEHAVGR